MANKKLDYEKVFQHIMDCRNSGLSDRQWCIENDIIPSTLYSWIRRLREHACCEIPDSVYRGEFHAPYRTTKQDVVRIDIVSEAPPVVPTSATSIDNAPVVIRYQDVNIKPCPIDFVLTNLLTVIHLNALLSSSLSIIILFYLLLLMFLIFSQTPDVHTLYALFAPGFPFPLKKVHMTSDPFS